MILTCYILIAIWAAQALSAIYLSRKFATRLQRPSVDPGTIFQPYAYVIAPFKGVDVDMDQAIDALFTQDYPDYELLLVVEAEDDKATPLLRAAIARHPNRKAQLLIAGKAPNNIGQKVHNQLHALTYVPPSDDGMHAWVFLDSDAVPHDGWLTLMTYQLIDFTRTGAVTGYRWLVPETGAGFWSQIASVINGSVASLQGGSMRKFGYAWGGSMAILEKTAIAGDLRRKWADALTDDYPLSHLCKDLNLRVYFPLRALVASPVRMTCAQLFNFAYRQYVLTRVYAPGLFRAAQVITAMYVAGLVAAWTLVISGVDRIDRTPFAIGVGALFFVAVCNQLRHHYRRTIIAETLGHETLTNLAPVMRLDRWATSLWMVIHALLVWRAQFGKSFIWRNVRYRLRGPNDIERLD